MNIQQIAAVFVSVIVVATMTACGGAYSSTAAPTATPEILQIPKDWNTADTSHFVVALPPEMKEKNVRGIDTALWEYNAPNISLSIELGFLGGDLNFERNRYESSLKTVFINGLKAQRVELDLNKPVLRNWAFNADGSTKIPTESKNLVVALYFHDKEAKFWIDRTSDVPVSTADSILNSIRFK